MKTLKKALNGFEPETALVLGSGLGDVVDAIEITSRHPFGDLENFPVSAVSGHSAEVICGTLDGHKLLLLSGRVHYYEKGDPAAMRPPLEALKSVGIKRLILTNSAGSTDPDMGPGSIMQIKDHINFSGTNPLFGEPTDDRFVGLTSAYDKPLRKLFRKKAKQLGIKLHRGVYMWFSGPSFETPAEIKLSRILGADAVGMSTVPEVILARFLGMDVAAFSVITNFAAGMTGNELSHTETKEMAPKGGETLSKLLSATLPELNK